MLSLLSLLSLLLHHPLQGEDAVLLLGGVAGGYEYVTGVEDIAASAGCWADVPDLPAGRANAGAAL